MDLGVIIDPAYKVLCTQIVDEINNRTIDLATGSALRRIDDTKSVAEKYAESVAYIQALSSVIELCKELERKRFGAGPKDRDD